MKTRGKKRNAHMYNQNIFMFQISCKAMYTLSIVFLVYSNLSFASKWQLYPIYNGLTES